MRLIRTRDLVFKDFTERETPPYAILSHRWGLEEVSYQVLRCLVEPDGNKSRTLGYLWQVDDSLRHGKGFEKIKCMCDFAHEMGLDWIWIDTCCINKESSAELSEAINSMFNWYKKANVCYAYLSDVSRSTPEFDIGLVARSEWFSRGWTLQELLAPSTVIFLDAQYGILGSKTDLEDIIASATGIDPDCIAGRKTVFDECVATRMSWAAKRTTTRTEDLAYCLLGIFNINMPLLYGEGVKAFRRLQEEIVRNSDDETIFVHTYALHIAPQALAHHPRNFTRQPKVLNGVPARFLRTGIGSTSYSMTNKGVQMRAPFVHIDETQRGMLLNCRFQGEDYPVIIPITTVRQGDPFIANAQDSKLSQVSRNVWRIRHRSSYEQDVKRAKEVVDIAMDGPGDPFDYDTIYLR